DPNGAAGPNHYVQIVNSDFAIFNKAGTPVYGPVPTNTLWSGFGGGCQTNNDGDATVEYDRLADRWIISQFSVSTTPFLQCVAVSTSGDPTGSYNRYAFQYSASRTTRSSASGPTRTTRPSTCSTAAGRRSPAPRS